MKQNSSIQEALQMIDHHDWYWMMSEEYTRSYNAAKASMKTFVALVSTITDATIREALKALWMLRYNKARNAINGKAIDTTNEEAELMSTIALAA